MNAIEYAVLNAELELAQGQIKGARACLNRVRQTAPITGDINLQPIHLANYHLTEAQNLIDRATGAEKVGRDVPIAPSENVGSSDPLAPSAQEARAASALECGDSSPLSNANEPTEQPNATIEPK